MFNKNKFRGKIAENGTSIEGVAKALNINSATLHRKMNGISDFSRTEIQNLIAILHLSSDDVEAIFFST